jgi:hypothetical protein
MDSSPVEIALIGVAAGRFFEALGLQRGLEIATAYTVLF